MIEPYYTDEHVTLFHGDCREVTEWLNADVLVADPPYGIGWHTSELGSRRRGKRVAPSRANAGIQGDQDTSVRDAALEMWGDRPAAVFGALTLAPPAGTRQVLVYRKPPDSGARGATAGFQRDIEAVYLVGPWPSGIGGRTSILSTAARMVGGTSGIAARYGHPHAKPVDVLEELLGTFRPGKVADPFAGSGSTLIAARNLGRQAIGVELEEQHCERIALRLAQTVLEVG